MLKNPANHFALTSGSRAVPTPGAGGALHISGECVGNSAETNTALGPIGIDVTW